MLYNRVLMKKWEKENEETILLNTDEGFSWMTDEWISWCFSVGVFLSFSQRLLCSIFILYSYYCSLYHDFSIELRLTKLTLNILSPSYISFSKDLLSIFFLLFFLPSHQIFTIKEQFSNLLFIRKHLYLFF